MKMKNRHIDKSKVSIIKCKHCGKEMERTDLVGMSPVCPSCGKPQNGQLKGF